MTRAVRMPRRPRPARTRRSRAGRRARRSRPLDGERDLAGHGVCKLPGYVDLYYPNDHGGGANEIHPRGAAWDYTRYVQDNDAALGLTVELVSKSPCWASTVIFVVEDDTQNGLDHVDGYRSLFLAISLVKHENVAKAHLSLASVFKTVDLILGIPPLSQYDAAATDLRDLFAAEPDFTPYDFIQPTYVASANPSCSASSTHGIEFRDPDRDSASAGRLPAQKACRAGAPPGRRRR